MEIPSREDFGMVWMGDMLLQNESNDIMMENAVDSPFFVDSNSQSITEDEIRCRNQMGIDGFMMLEDLDDSSRWYVNGMSEEMFLDNDPSNAAKVVTTSTQTGLQNAPPGSRKIKPVKHPGLKLQTPIAYQRDTDLNVIPIQKEGRAVCKKCGAIGVKHAFYTRERRYCSLACARGSVDSDINNQETASSPSNTQWNEETTLSQQQLLPENNPAIYLGINCNQPQYLMQQQNLLESQLPPVFILQPEESSFSLNKKQLSNLAYSYNWSLQLNDASFMAAPTSCFKHAPMADLWHYIDVGLKVEVENTDSEDFCEEFPNSFWIASVLRVEGYKALLRYEGFVEDGSKDFWVNLCSSSIHPVGWCAVRGKPLIPPKTIKDKYNNWKEFLKRRLTGARTLPSNFYSKVHDSLKSRFRCDLTVEVVDKARISQVKVATIEKIIGKRLQLRYYDSKPNNAQLFWCHEDSPLIHPVGWSQRIGQKLDASHEYYDRMMKGLREKDDSTADLFITPERCSLSNSYFFQEGMKLEAVDPLNLADICVATVMQVLNDGYLMICVDFWNDQHPSTEDWFCYHMTSACIFPPGFCAANNISLTPPKDYNKATFDWNRYLQETGCIAAPAPLFNQEIPDHGFKVGMKLEAADLMNPRLVCVATITHTVRRLLKIHFDGWETDFDQWLDCNSCDIYPVGWCELVSHKLEPPLNESKPVITETRSAPRKKRGKGRHSSSHGLSYKPVMQMKDKIMEFNDVKDSLFESSVTESSSNFIIDNSTSNISEMKNSNKLEEWTTTSFIANNYDNGPNLSTCDSKITNREIKMRSSNPEKKSENIKHVSSSNSSISSNTQQPPQEETSNKCVEDKPKVIPRLSEYKTRGSSINILPETWDISDVAEFLKINDCSTYCEAFIKQGINGRKLLELTKEEVHVLVGMKVGPSLKIQNLITQLTSKIYPTHSRHNKTSKNIL